MTLNQRFGLLLGAGWGLFGVVGLWLQWVLPIPKVVVLIDRSYCPSGKWHQVVDNYTTLYHRHQRRQIVLEKIILFNTLGQDTLTVPPLPRTVNALKPYGQLDAKHQAEMQQAFPKGRFLGCKGPAQK